MSINFRQLNLFNIAWILLLPSMKSRYLLCFEGFARKHCVILRSFSVEMSDDPSHIQFTLL